MPSPAASCRVRISRRGLITAVKHDAGIFKRVVPDHKAGACIAVWTGFDDLIELAVFNVEVPLPGGVGGPYRIVAIGPRFRSLDIKNICVAVSAVLIVDLKVIEQNAVDSWNENPVR